MTYGPSGGKFYSARIKLQRAVELIMVLEYKTNEWIKNNPSYIIHETNAGSGIETVKLISAEPPLDMSLLTGEILHNIRGALDHMVSSIVGHIKGAPDLRVNFPFHETWVGFKELRNIEKNKKNRHPLFNEAPDIWYVIEKEIKPYTDKEGNRRLWEINKLNNADKHRLLLTSTSKSTTNVDLGRVGYEDNYLVAYGGGEVVIATGYNLKKGSVIGTEAVLFETEILPVTPLFLFLKESHNIVLGIVEKIEMHFFAP